MTIHHDKMAYGKLAKLQEELSEEKLAQMIKEMNGGDEEQNPPESQPSDFKPVQKSPNKKDDNK